MSMIQNFLIPQLPHQYKRKLQIRSVRKPKLSIQISMEVLGASWSEKESEIAKLASTMPS